MLEINGTILAVILNFLLLVWVLKAFLFKPLENMVRQRKEKIESQIKEAQGRLLEAGELKTSYEGRLKNAEEESGQIVKKASEFAAKIKTDAFEAAKLDAAQLIRRAKAEAQAEKDQAIRQAKGQLAQLIVLASEKLLKRSISEKDRDDSINEAIERLEKAELN